MHNIASIETTCVGCLSDDRKLYFLDEECQQVYCGYLNQLNLSMQISLCFECRAYLQRAIQFRKQIQHAHSVLAGYLVKKKLKSLSSLSFRDIIHIDSYNNHTGNLNNVVLTINTEIFDQNNVRNCCSEGEVKDEQFQRSDQKTNSFDQETNSYDQKTNSSDQKTYSSDQKTNYQELYDDQKLNFTEPLAFVKMEDATADQEMNYDHDDQDLKVELEKTSFSDSDDEPLTVKSKKYKEKRKVKEKHGSRRRRNKEQPSGVVKDPRVEKKLRDLNVEPGLIALVMLSWEEVEEERRLSLQSVQFTRHAHRCSSCIVGYNHLHKLEEHNRKHSLEAGSEVCDICNIRCKTKPALASHRRRHRARWVCMLCGSRYSQACVAADHCGRAHGARPTHACTRCAHVAQSLGALRMHIKSHSSRPECNLCGKTFRDKSSLRTHAFVHRGEKEHACSVCEKRFMFKKQKEIHEITHMEHQHLYCHQCDVSFKNQTSYYQHMKYNLKHIDPADIKHACQLCDKRFVKAKRLEEHNLAVHLKLAPIKCTQPECSFACPSRAALRSHIRLVHRGAKAIRNHVCHRCGNTYKSKKSLEGHLRSHITRQTTEAVST